MDQETKQYIDDKIKSLEEATQKNIMEAIKMIPQIITDMFTPQDNAAAEPVDEVVNEETVQVDE